jgi:hypothetical protein
MNNVLSLYLFLEKLDSPLLRHKPGQSVATMDLFRVLYAQTIPVGESLALVAQGLEVFDAAVIGWAGTLTPDDLGQKIEGLFNTLTPEAQHAAAAVRQAVVALTPAPTQGQVAENAPTQRHDHEEQQQQK